MPSALEVASGIGRTVLQIILLPMNFVIWLLSSPQFITLLCILSEVLIELVVSAVLAGVSVIVSAVIIMEDEPEPTITMTSSTPPKKSFLYGGDEPVVGRKCDDSVMTRARSTSTRTLSQLDDQATDKKRRSVSLLDSWLPKFGAPREGKKSTVLADESAKSPEGSLVQAVDSDPSASLVEEAPADLDEPTEEGEKVDALPEVEVSPEIATIGEEINEKFGSVSSRERVSSVKEDPPA